MIRAKGKVQIYMIMRHDLSYFYYLYRICTNVVQYITYTYVCWEIKAYNNVYITYYMNAWAFCNIK